MTTATEVKEHPILFTGPMVRAILDGTKTQTRRLVKGASGPCIDRIEMNDDGDWHAGWPVGDEAGQTDVDWCPVRCPYGQPGDRLWVVEFEKIDG